MGLIVGDYVWVEKYYMVDGWVEQKRPAVILRFHQKFRHRLSEVVSPYVKFLDGVGGVAEVAEVYCARMSPMEALVWGTK